MFQGRKKAVTFSYDDAVTQDQRLIALFGKYGLKGTFNINSGLLGRANSLVREDVTVAHVKPRACEVRKIYQGHEIAAHSLTHPFLPDLEEEEIVCQVEQDRLALSEIAGYEVVGFAYPCGGKNCDDRVADILRRRTGVRYARTLVSSGDFAPQSDLMQFKPSVYHNGEWDNLFSLGRRFVELEPETEQIFYIWGHAYEFDIANTWDRFEEFLRLISGHADIFYGTNREVLLAEEDT